jgi:hypothetical protein
MGRHLGEHLIATLAIIVQSIPSCESSKDSPQDGMLRQSDAESSTCES